LKVVRSWPETIPPGRRFVDDGLERLVMADYDYATALGRITEDVVLLEWDIEIDPAGLDRFVVAARAQPDRVVVAPYRLYPPSTGLDGPVWAHRRADNAWIGDGEPTCALFGFGMVYLPVMLIRRYLTDGLFGYGLPYPRYFDSAFSRWHHENVRRQVPVLWDVCPEHLHD
jgi:hypothetical protein